MLKGKAYLSLKQLSRAAQRTFVNDPTMVAKFGVDILNRRGHKHSNGGKGTTNADAAKA